MYVFNCVKKTGTPFNNLFVSQMLEQHIRGLKVAGGITGITQHESVLNRFLLTASELTSIVRDFQNQYSSPTDTCLKEHYHLSGVAQRSPSKAENIKCGLDEHCDGNPFGSTCVKKFSVVAGNKVMKLHEDRQLLDRFLVIQQSRPNMVGKLGDTTGNYEMAVTPRPLFATDGTLLIPNENIPL